MELLAELEADALELLEVVGYIVGVSVLLPDLLELESRPRRPDLELLEVVGYIVGVSVLLPDLPMLMSKTKTG